MSTRRRSITSTVPALFETATSAPQPECIRTPMAARFMSEVCLRMYYGEFISSFAARLGKIGHLNRDARLSDQSGVITPDARHSAQSPGGSETGTSRVNDAD